YDSGSCVCLSEPVPYVENCYCFQHARRVQETPQLMVLVFYYKNLCMYHVLVSVFVQLPAVKQHNPNLHLKMFKYLVVLMALIAAVFASPKPQFLYAPASYSYSESYRQPAATVYSSGAYSPIAYTNSYAAPALYNAPYPAAYVY
uniref:Uncharacterized protein n=1 Tax=Anopheles minimus TaxID=112268 RepID=A0A182VUZ8_9DIPT